MTKEDVIAIKNLEKKLDYIYWQLCDRGLGEIAASIMAIEFELAQLRGYEGD